MPIDNGDRTKLLIAAQTLLTEAGYSLDTSCWRLMVWFTADRQWQLEKMFNGTASQWMITPTTYKLTPKECLVFYAARFRTRDAAVEWAQENMAVE